ncbi:hypothetical protein MNBD_GAMMA26-317 [hydrothermal vent metagenome]|uniref:General secretion pathway protein M n=1 Tax=hydrothermal vent metagenome TaxID=652676 RepID=A0A3B1AU62_9ZZZZ
MRRWWANLESREQRMLLFALVSVVVLGGHMFLVEPFMMQRELLISRVEAQKKLKMHLENVAQEANALRDKANSAKKLSGKGGNTLLAVVSTTSRSNGVKDSMKRIAPEGNRKARIWLEDAPFDQIVAWLTSVTSSYVVKIDSVNVNAEEIPGVVRAKLTLATPK